MKQIIFTLVVILVCVSAKSQLANHKWNGTLQLDNQPTPVTMDFKKDTVKAMITQSGAIMETMLFTVKKDVVTFKKVEGQSSCGTDVVGKYKFALVKDSITLTLTEDICADRAGVLDKSVWAKVRK